MADAHGPGQRHHGPLRRDLDMDDTRTPNGPLPALWGEHEPGPGSIPWASRCDEITEAFAHHMYGTTPDGGRLRELRQVSRDEREGLLRSEWDAVVEGPLGQRVIHVLVHQPARAQSAPVFIGLNFEGNHAIDAAARRSEHPTYTPAFANLGDGAPTRDTVVSSWAPGAPAPAGHESGRWPAAMVVARGYALVTAHCADLELDAPGHGPSGVRGLFDTDPDRADRPADGWGAVGAWAWGMSRLLDVVAQLSTLDADRAIAIGHSRLGKAALWAAVQDERFAACVSNQSGCAGAAVLRDKGGEDIATITRVFPHWFAPNFASYAGREDELPVDAHLLLASLAPRPLCVGSAEADAWADPHNERLATELAAPAFVGVDPPLHWQRAGGHGLTVEDWAAYLDWADRHFPH